MDKWQQALDGAVGNAASVLRGLVQDLARSGDTDVFGDRFLNVLEELHLTATVAGRSRAGDLSPQDIDDRRFAETVVAGEDFYLASFLNDLDDGRYRDEEGTLSENAVLARSRMYLNKAKATANETWALTDGGPFHWILGEPETGHCDECPALAALSPFALHEIPTYPRGGDTSCMMNCLCVLRGPSGTTSFE